jgi:hypothetical protein
MLGPRVVCSCTDLLSIASIVMRDRREGQKENERKSRGLQGRSWPLIALHVSSSISILPRWGTVHLAAKQEMFTKITLRKDKIQRALYRNRV